MLVMQYCYGLPDVQFNSEIKIIVIDKYNFDVVVIKLELIKTEVQ